ncbi:MAG: FliO/MopB family protein [Candidatus Azotimanducaceae bacterium]
MSSDLFLRVFASLVFILIVLGAVYWWLKTNGPKINLEDRAQLQLLSRVQIDARHKLVLVKVDDARFLVGTSPSDITIVPVDQDKTSAEFKDYLSSQLDEDKN